jgi:hypothetical protein
LVFILILILRQAPPALMVDHQPGSRSILQETNLINRPQGFGWTEDMNNGDPKEIPSVFQAFQDEEPLFMGAAALKLFRFSFHNRSNPLLIDRPPPAMGT